MSSEHEHPGEEHAVELPTPTSWPITLALAVTLLFAGIVTNWTFTIIGAAIFLLAAIGWFRHVFIPAMGEYHEPKVAESARPRPVVERRDGVEKMAPGLPGHRLSVPEKIHPYSAGAKGGLIGGIAMTIPALVYGVLSSMDVFVNLGWESTPRTIWFPINVLVAMFWPGAQTVAELNQFNMLWLVLGLVLHLTLSLGLGLIYGVILPMLPGKPIFWGGVVAPLLWTGALFGAMRALDPLLTSYIHWPAFITSQFVYGLVVGIVVVRTEKIYVRQRGDGGSRMAISGVTDQAAPSSESAPRQEESASEAKPEGESSEPSEAKPECDSSEPPEKQE